MLRGREGGASRVERRNASTRDSDCPGERTATDFSRRFARWHWRVQSDRRQLAATGTGHSRSRWRRPLSVLWSALKPERLGLLRKMLAGEFSQLQKRLEHGMARIGLVANSLPRTTMLPAVADAHESLQSDFRCARDGLITYCEAAKHYLDGLKTALAEKAKNPFEPRSRSQQRILLPLANHRASVPRRVAVPAPSRRQADLPL